MPVTLEQLADELDVSVATVSRAMQDVPPAKRPAARARVEAIRRHAASRGYRPNLVARTMQSGVSTTVGLLLVETFHNPVYLRLAEAIDRAVRSRGHRLQIGLVHHDEPAGRLLDEWRGQRFAGAVAGPFWNAERFERVRGGGGSMPTVAYGGLGDIDGIDACVIDFPSAWRATVDHLVARGHRRLGWIGAAGIRWDRVFAGHGRSTAEPSATFDPAWRFKPPHEGQGGRQDAIAAFARRFRAAPAAERPTAVVCNNDDAAMRLMSAFRAEGVRVPHDCSVIGLDNLPESAFLCPPLTTLDLRLPDLAEHLVGLLFDRMRDPDADTRTIVQSPTLVARSSVADLSSRP